MWIPLSTRIPGTPANGAGGSSTGPRQSPPYYISTIDTAYAIDGITKTVSTDPVNTIMADTDKMEYKLHTTWFTIASSDVQITDIWGSGRQAVSGQSQVTVLNMYFDPAQRNNNYSQNLFTKLFLNPTKAWGGAQLLLSAHQQRTSPIKI